MKSLSFTVKLAVLAAVVVSEIAVTAILAPRFHRQGNSIGIAAILGSAVVTIAVLAYVLFVVIA